MEQQSTKLQQAKTHRNTEQLLILTKARTSILKISPENRRSFFELLPTETDIRLPQQPKQSMFVLRQRTGRKGCARDMEISVSGIKNCIKLPK